MSDRENIIKALQATSLALTAMTELMVVLQMVSQKLKDAEASNRDLSLEELEEIQVKTDAMSKSVRDRLQQYIPQD